MAKCISRLCFSSIVFISSGNRVKISSMQPRVISTRNSLRIQARNEVQMMPNTLSISNSLWYIHPACSGMCTRRPKNFAEHALPSLSFPQSCTSASPFSQCSRLDSFVTQNSFCSFVSMLGTLPLVLALVLIERERYDCSRIRVSPREHRPSCNRCTMSLKND
ncbi:unnamed protein product [Albugo candida]|uniref:Uncharacterized protein n=1 Tax=Albugo candida TaxID=65357 RepID=A0A024GKH9_9STRA|nr:unnamed protein product [Albugo candida]|eukprot:CCI47376.1 unnamed protein product [Albugo candida]